MSYIEKLENYFKEEQKKGLMAFYPCMDVLSSDVDLSDMSSEVLAKMMLEFFESCQTQANIAVN